MASSADAAVRADGGDSELWAVRAASLCGTGHRLVGAGPDDAYAWAAHDATLTVAVADGVSNRPGSAKVAAAAADAAAGEAAVAGPPLAVQSANLAARLPGEGATTLVVAVLDGSGHARLARVGDSSAFVLYDLGWREVWRPEVEDGTIRTATAALPSDRPDVGEAEVSLGPGEVLVLVTDGVADPLRDGPTTVAPGLAAGLAVPPEPLDLARLLDFSRQGVHDDRTLVAVWPLGGPDRPDGQ